MVQDDIEQALARGDYPRILAAFCSSPWAILPAKLAQVRAVLLARCRGEKATPLELEAARREPPPVKPRGKVGVIQVFGTISKRPSLFASGGTSTETVGRLLDQAVGDPDIKSIVLQIDSPGGSVYGVSELAAKVREARGKKTVVASVDPLAASAAYWIAAQASEVHITPSGQAGSIGVFAAHEDVSKMADLMGVKTTLVSAGKYKTEANPFSPLSEEARAAIQANVDRYYGLFVDDVARGRGRRPDTVKSGFGEGRMVGATEAVREGMADRVSTFEETIRRLGGAGVALSVTRASLDLDEIDD